MLASLQLTFGSACRMVKGCFWISWISRELYAYICDNILGNKKNSQGSKMIKKVIKHRQVFSSAKKWRYFFSFGRIRITELGEICHMFRCFFFFLIFWHLPYERPDLPTISGIVLRRSSFTALIFVHVFICASCGRKTWRFIYNIQFWFTHYAFKDTTWISLYQDEQWTMNVKWFVRCHS